MQKCRLFVLFGALILSLACSRPAERAKYLDFIAQVEQISDSTRIGGIVIKNLFKSQILAHKNAEFDSLMIVNKVYEPHRALWDNCYAMIFGEENASKFNSKTGMIAWNRELYPQNKTFFDERAEILIQMNLDSVLNTNLNRFNDLVPYPVKATISILFTPITGILFGGCENDQFCIELNYEEQELAYTLEKGIPHELNHLAYGPLREKDVNYKSALGQTIDEGFACYFTWVFFNREIPRYEAVENMTQADWDWFIKNEKEIFLKVEKYFDDESGDNPLLRNDRMQLFKDAPKSLNYWLGFRIVEKYVEKNGVESWKDIYGMDVKQLLLNSGYANFIHSL